MKARLNIVDKWKVVRNCFDKTSIDNIVEDITEAAEMEAFVLKETTKLEYARMYETHFNVMINNLYDICIETPISFINNLHYRKKTTKLEKYEHYKKLYGRK